MTKEELGKLYPIELSEYTTNWKQLYEQEIKDLQMILGGDLALGFEHIGSTAIPGMLAKPTIDILVDIPEDTKPSEIIDKMPEDYIRMQEVTSYMMFVKGYTPTGLANESFHIHLGPKSRHFLWDRVFFRDYMIMNPDERKEYIFLKIELQEKFKYDREGYTHGKGEYIKRITKKAKESANSKTHT